MPELSDILKYLPLELLGFLFGASEGINSYSFEIGDNLTRVIFFVTSIFVIYKLVNQSIPLVLLYEAEREKLRRKE